MTIQALKCGLCSVSCSFAKVGPCSPSITSLTATLDDASAPECPPLDAYTSNLGSRLEGARAGRACHAAALLYTNLAMPAWRVKRVLFDPPATPRDPPDHIRVSPEP